MRIEHPYEFVQGTTPLLISMPHPGLLLPEEVADLLTSEARALPDTDWHIPQLYGFAAKIGASLVMARYSRFAVDLVPRAGSLPTTAFSSTRAPSPSTVPG